MKKLFIIGLSMLMLIGLTASAFATDVNLSGKIEVRGEWNNNTTDYDEARGDVGRWYDENVMLRVDAKVTPRTNGVIVLETDGADPYGGWVNKDIWGQNASAATGWAEGNTVTDIISIREAYIHHTGSGLLGVPSGLKVGRMSIKLGRGLFFDHTLFGDQGIVLYANPTKGSQISFTTLKLDENTAIGASTALTPQADDTDAYVLGYSTTVDKINLSGDLTYADDQDFTAYTSVTGRRVTSPLQLWNLGLRGDTSVRGIALYGDLELQYGSAENNYLHRTTATRENREYRGYALLLGGTMDVNPARVNLEFAWGRGDKRDYTVTNANDGTATFDSGAKNEQFMTTLGADQQHYTYVYEDRVPSATGARGTGIANTLYLKLGAETDVNPDLTLGGSIYYLRATNATNVGGAMDSAGFRSPSRDLGWEVDGDLKYKLDTNLVYFVQAGYMFTGAVYNIDDNTNATNGVNKTADNAYVLRHGISLLF